MRSRFAAALGAAFLAACTGPQHALDTRGPAAERIAELWWVMLALATLVTVVVAVMLAIALRRSSDRAGGREVGTLPERRVVVLFGAAIPAVILFAVLIASYRAGADVYPPRSEPADALTIDVVGHQFWWEVRYPDHGIATANEIHIPVGRPVRLRLHAPDVIHSFWVPQLHGKTDLIPGRINTLWLTADEPGAFRGQCAEFCGLSHALMALWLVAVPEAEFSAWLDRRSAALPTAAERGAARGREVFEAAGCDQCHTTQGTPERGPMGSAGPDLRDLGARRTLAAGTLPNTREALEAWIADPDSIKPGNRMPPTPLSEPDMAALLDYLQSLR